MLIRQIKADINILLLLTVLYKVIPNNFTIELYYYFAGLVGASFAFPAAAVF